MAPFLSMAHGAAVIVCKGGLAIWDENGLPTECLVNIWLPLGLVVGLFLSIPIRQALDFGSRSSNGENYQYQPLPDAEEVGGGADPIDQGSSFDRDIWFQLSTSLLIAGILSFAAQVIYAMSNSDTPVSAAASGVILLFAWLPFLALHVRNSIGDSGLFYFSAYSLVTLGFKAVTLASTGIETSQDYIAIFQVIVSGLLLLVWGLGAFGHLDDWQSRNSYRIPVSAPLPTLESRASWIERMTFAWVTPIIMLGERKVLSMDDVWALLPKDAALSAHRAFSFQLTNGPGVTLFKAIYRTVRHLALIQLLLALSVALLEFTGPFFLNRIVNYLEEGKHLDDSGGESRTSTARLPWFYIFGLLVAGLVRAVVENRVYFIGRRMGLRIKSALVAHIYSKVLRRRQVSGEGSASIGETQTLFSVDVSKLSDFASMMDGIVSAPVALLIALASLYTLLGWSALIGIGVMIAFLPLQAVTGKMIRNRQDKLMKTTDARVSLVNEMLQGIRMIKYFYFEPHFEEKLRASRETELQALIGFGYFLAFVQVLFRSIPILVSLVTFASFVGIQGGKLDVTTVFTALSLFTVLKGPLYQLPMKIVGIFEVRVSLDRIAKFLQEDEAANIVGDAQVHQGILTLPPNTPITMADASFSWARDATGFQLQKLSVQFKPGGLNIVIGPVGAGKSSLLMALLGEMYRISGTVTKSQSVAYISQSAWLQSCTVKENILFGSPLDQELYKKVINACALTRDIAIFDHGDATQIGEKGVALSGGQKSRVALARATYFALKTGTASPIFADDVLSAVDAPTARHILTECLTGILEGHTRILVTHASGLVLPEADHIVVMDKGTVAAQGTLTECRLKLAGTNLVRLLDTSAAADSDADGTGRSRSRSPSPSRSAESAPPKPLHDAGDEEEEEEGEEESKRSGSVPWSVYAIYLRATGGAPFWSVMLTLHFGQYMLGIAADNMLRVWATDPTATGLAYLAPYAAFGIGQLVVAYISPVFEFFGSTRASRTMHEQLVHRVLRAPIQFMDKVPIGRIINRFSKDINEVDHEICGIMAWFLITVIDFFTSAALVTYVAPSFLAFLPPILWLYWQVAKVFLSTSRELKRLEAVSRSPIYSSFSETLNGVPTIRAFGQSRRFINEQYDRVDAHHRPWWYMWMANRWLTLRTQLLDAVLTFAAALAIVIGVHLGAVTAGWAGLALTYALNVGEAILWLPRIHASLEMQMNSVERIDEYLHIPQEMPVITEVRPQSNWPAHGRVSVQQLCLKYPNTEKWALDHVSFDIPAACKAAIVGRTGSGKSSLANMFFRLYETNGGRIVVDDMDISKIGLGDLRVKLTCIPQDPVMFSGTVRSNLDMFSEYSDSELDAALQRVHLTEAKLDDVVSEGASNWSLGQRQLIALARALLRRSRVLILDESTASVDNNTDEKIQHALRQDFVTSTVICIAHRLRTIIDYDFVLVLDQGRVMESGRPIDLMQKSAEDPSAIFRGMCEESGDWDVLLGAATAKAAAGTASSG
ncbi:hypothetical protein BC828DRAFT_384016 [Blastocladiella britannica]|nr:hypothetical protein BC828DRAFT_384016 [Blastocladiella britannica]